MNTKIFKNDLNTENILKCRARKLAEETSAEINHVNTITVVEFQIAHEIYAIELKRIRVIHPLKALTFIPGTPDFIRGVINLRGEIISVVDLKVFFDLPDQDFTNLSQVIILSSDEMEFGILADEVLGVAELSKKDIRPSLPTLTGIRADYLMGVTGNSIVVLDVEKLLTDKKMVINL
ncbi:MAG: chemotaxis protein CheW [Desulfobacteraceae bacterium]|jgi:purine-binding chemotaxis protein CheW|nr:chemotaxis protein CheW [Desulfobacteraceae bacterium]